MQPRTEPAQLTTDRPTLIAYLLWVLGIGVPVLTVPAVTTLPLEPFVLISTFVVLLAGAVFTARRSGPGGVRRLFSGALQWRIGWRRWALVAGAIPTATLAVAAVTGTLSSPTDGWAATLGSYLFFTFVFGALVLNLWEETAWQGLVQRHLAHHHGVLKGAMLTAVPFAILHMPLAFVDASTTKEALTAAALILVLAPALRYLLGWLDRDTGGSLLAVGVLHASLNAAGALDVLDGGWQHIAGLAIVAASVLAFDRRAAARVGGRYLEQRSMALVGVPIAHLKHSAGSTGGARPGPQTTNRHETDRTTGDVMTEHHATHTSRRGARLLMGLLLGLAPGVLLILLAQFVITGEQELTVGTAGMWLAAAGALIGPVAALRSGRPSSRR